MSLERERKFLVAPERLPRLRGGTRITQVYLSLDPEVRVRLSAAGAWLTIKSEGGLVRSEFEYRIPRADAVQLTKIGHYKRVEKTRYRIHHQGLLWELDQYWGANHGLWTAEVELERSNEKVALPDWIEREVTGKPRFANQHLAVKPFRARKSRRLIA